MKVAFASWKRGKSKEKRRSEKKLVYDSAANALHFWAKTLRLQSEYAAIPM
jgi:hypothetical protein